MSLMFLLSNTTAFPYAFLENIFSALEVSMPFKSIFSILASPILSLYSLYKYATA
ncbi:MAG: hypothetical protein ACLTUN_01755 [Paraclostridium sordellii]